MSAVMSQQVLNAVLSLAECQELIFIQQSISVVGYRPHVRSSTIHDIAATEPALLIPLVRAREKVQEAVENAMGLPCGLLVEFTALMTWLPESSIGWHYDSNRPYLEQRHVAAVLYLNTGGGVDFVGGELQFRDDEPATVQPAAGTLVMYAADARNVHRVSPVVSGQRFTLTMWLTKDPAHSEDPKVISSLQIGNTLGLPSTLYLGEGMAGRDVREEKLLELGFVVAREGGNLMLINISNITSDAENDSGILTLPNAGGCDNSRVAAIRIDEISVVECDDLQTALAVAAYHQWNSLKSICDSRDRWRSYVARLKKELDRAKLEWNEVQALFTVDQQRFSEPNVT